jgi:hypothetical protein
VVVWRRRQQQHDGEDLDPGAGAGGVASMAAGVGMGVVRGQDVDVGPRLGVPGWRQARPRRVGVPSAHAPSQLARAAAALTVARQLRGLAIALGGRGERGEACAVGAPRWARQRAAGRAGRRRALRSLPRPRQGDPAHATRRIAISTRAHPTDLTKVKVEAARTAATSCRHTCEGDGRGGRRGAGRGAMAAGADALPQVCGLAAAARRAARREWAPLHLQARPLHRAAAARRAAAPRAAPRAPAPPRAARRGR